MSYLRSVLTDEQIDIYLNPNLGYYYLDAMKNLSMEGEIVFSRTVSTLGELISNTLVLPLDSAKTGYSSAVFSSDETNKSILLSGPKGVFFLQLPLQSDLNEESYDHDGIRLVRTDNEKEDGKNLSLRIRIAKKHDRYEDTEESRTHETDHYSVRITRDTADLPEGVSEEMISEMNPVEAELEVHYSSKLQLSSPTTMDISCRIRQGEYDFTLTGTVKTSSPWTFTPFDTKNAVQGDQYNCEDLEKLVNEWAENAEKTLVRTPEEILPADSAGDPDVSGTDDTEESEEAEPVDAGPEESPVSENTEETQG